MLILRKATGNGHFQRDWAKQRMMTRTASDRWPLVVGHLSLELGEIRASGHVTPSLLVTYTGDRVKANRIRWKIELAKRGNAHGGQLI